MGEEEREVGGSRRCCVRQGRPLGGIYERGACAQRFYTAMTERERGYESCERCTRECSVPRGYDVGLWGIGEMDGFEVAFKGWRMSMTR